jgi:hypothetical protein
MNIEICEDGEMLYSSLGVQINIFEKEPAVKIHTAILKLYESNILTLDDILASVARAEGALATGNVELERTLNNKDSTYKDIEDAVLNHDIKSDEYAIRLLGVSIDKYYESLIKLAMVTKTTEWKKIARKRLGLFLSFIMGINHRSSYGPYISYMNDCKAALKAKSVLNESN